MKEDTLKKICLCLKYNSVREVSISDFKDNLYELQKEEKYHELLNEDNKTKEEYDSMIEECVEYLKENNLALITGKYFYFYDPYSKFKKTEDEFNIEEKKLYFNLSNDFIKLNCKKYKDIDDVKTYKIKRSI